MKKIAALTILFVLLSPSPLWAADAAGQQKLQACLKKADELPDIAAADAESWFWHGGGEAARLCRDYALFNSGEYIPAAKGFVALAQLHEKKNPPQAATLYAQAGLAYLRGGDLKNAEAVYSKAVTLTPNDPEILTDRAEARISDQRYWDAIADLNQALKIRPHMVNALRQRGRAWTELGDSKNAEVDFRHAAEFDGEDPASYPAHDTAKK